MIRVLAREIQKSLAAGKPGWEGPPDCYRALGELTYLAGGLPQSFEQIARPYAGSWPPAGS